MTDLRSKYLPAIFILFAGTLLLLSAWIFLENRHITQLEDMADPTAQDTAIGTEYQDQVDYLENYIKENGVENIKTDENGRVADEEMLKNVDINGQPMLEAVQNALANEKND